MLDKIKEEVYKCSKCGLCQSVCPIYITTKNEIYLPRGRYNILNNFFNSNKSLSKKFIENLDLCFNCNACKRFCPSNINSAKIFTQIKFENNYKYSFFSFHIVYKFILCFMVFVKNIYRFLRFKSIFVNTFLDSIFDIKVKLSKYNTNNKTKEKVVYFQGCINKYINPSDKHASVNILKSLGYNIVNISEKCCGLPYLSDGKLNKKNKNASKIINSIPDDIKYIVCSCDSCYETLSQIDAIKNKIIRLDEILRINNINITPNENAVFFKPIIREDEINIPSEMKVINKKGSCSYMENYFLIKHLKETKKMIKYIFDNSKEMDDKVIITTCNLSSIGLKYCISKINSKVKVYLLSEYLDSFIMK